eukprot:TRINITY_DN5558_c0_g1_i1.p2 TRINITY_DN5558_c0_g1~~TRINITY_DN5558_c0_g1_i1.p2  ORF type:complete len:137 (-),score=18.85 TRINITY_DN5558_c0_g1_i1:462-872(-)
MLVFLDCFCFFFSSRRRHTRFCLSRGLGDVYKRQGYIGLFKGNQASIAKAAPALALEFTIYDFCKQVILKKEPDNIGSSLLMGAVSGFVSSVITYPLDLLRTTLMTKSEGTNQQGTLSVMKKIYKKHGIQGMFKGI